MGSIPSRFARRAALASSHVNGGTLYRKRNVMKSFRRYRTALAPVFALILSCGIAHAAELNPAAVTFKLPDQIDWKSPPGDDHGVRNAVLVGDPSKPGLMSS